MAVSKFEIKSRILLADRKSFGETGSYEQLEGVVHFNFDPGNLRNKGITDIELAPRFSNGMVRCSAGFLIFKPTDLERSNHRIFYDVVNRGGNQALRFFNRAPYISDPSEQLDLGDGFLMRQGYTVVLSGWQHDVPSVKGLLNIKVPNATTPEGSLSGKLMIIFQPDFPIKVQVLSKNYHHVKHNPYPTRDLNDPEATLYVRDNEDAPAHVIPRDQWSFAKLQDEREVPDPAHIYMPSGFITGKVYQLVYYTNGAPVIGLGLLGILDLISFLRYGKKGEGNPCADKIEFAYTFGSSQSGRILRQLLYMGLNEDEHERIVFDGMISHIAGARIGEFNQRFGQPSTVEKESVGALFPFTDTEQTDPEIGISEGLLSRLRGKDKMPKVIYTNTASEYWRGDGALLHTSVDGTQDIKVPDNVRIYQFGGVQHDSGIYPLTNESPFDDMRMQHSFNTVEYYPLLRSLLVRLDRWITQKEPPPPSKHPRIDDSTAVEPQRTEQVFKRIPSVNFPGHLRHIDRYDFGSKARDGLVEILPPKVGKPYRTFVSAVDEDGNEIAGVRLPEITVPLATFTGWNLRHPDIGAPEQYAWVLGSIIPFAVTKKERKEIGDPRLSIEERYESKNDFLDKVNKAARKLVEEGFLLVEDIEIIMEQLKKRYDFFRNR